MRQDKYDVVVIGSGVGGMCAAALLANKGYKTLVVEKLPLIGGRCSTLEYKGFKVPTGVVAVPMTGVLKDIFDEVGATFNVRPFPQARYLVDGKEFQPPEKGGFRALLSHLCRDEAESTRVISAMRRADTWEEPSNEISLRDWFLQYTINEKVLGLFQNICATLLVTNAHETSAKEFFLVRKGMARSYAQSGFAVRGSITLMEALAEVIRTKDGAVCTGCTAKKILVANGAVSGAIVEGEKGDVEITAKVVVSNAGPKKTVALAGGENFDKGYLKEIANMKPGLQIWVTTISDKPLYDAPNLATLQARRMLFFMTPTHICPELAPAGKHLHYSISGPDSQTGTWNLKKEVDLHVQDLRDNIPGFSKYGDILHVGCYWGDWPNVRNVPLVGYTPLSQKTPVENLYNVGDGVGLPGWSGASIGCAMTARVVVADIEKRLKPEGA